MDRTWKYYQRLKSFLFPYASTSHYKQFKCIQKSVNGIKLNYVKVGRGEPLVFIHGWTNNWQGWIPIVTHLRQKFTLYLIDLPGFGHSGDLPHYSVQIAADYISKFIKTLPAAPSIVSLSMGSFVGADLTLRYPNSIKRAILTGAVVADSKHKRLPATVELFLRAVRKSTISKAALKRLIETRAAAYFAAKYLNMYRWNREIVDLYGMVGKKLVRKEAYVDMGISASRYDMKNTLTRLSVPTMLILGDKDIYTSAEIVKKEILPLNKKLFLSVIKDAGHVIPWEKPKEVAALITKFCF